MSPPVTSDAPRPAAAPDQPAWLEGLLIPTQEDSPGPVRFNHSDHVDLRRPDCASCHAGLFSLTTERAAAEEAARTEDSYHERCGVCHNGDDASDYEDDCELCHAE